MLLDDVKAQIQCGEIFHSYAENAAESEYQNARKSYLSECKKNSDQLEKFSTAGKKRINDAVSNIEREFDSLESQNCVEDFQSRANAYLHDKFLAISTDIQTQLKKNFPSQDFDAPNFFAEYIAAVKNYSVPKPVGKIVNNQSEVKRIIGMLIFPTFLGAYETVYENYSDAAKKNLRDTLLESLKKSMNQAFNSIKIALEPPPPVKKDTLAKEISASKKEWSMLEAEISKYLDFCCQKFVWGIGNYRKIFPHEV